MTDTDVAVDVFVAGEWLPGRLASWQRWPDGSWRGNVEWTRLVRPSDLGSPFVPPNVVDEPAPFTWCKTLPAERIRKSPAEP